MELAHAPGPSGVEGLSVLGKLFSSESDFLAETPKSGLRDGPFSMEYFREEAGLDVKEARERAEGVPWVMVHPTGPFFFESHRERRNRVIGSELGCGGGRLFVQHSGHTIIRRGLYCHLNLTQ